MNKSTNIPAPAEATLEYCQAIESAFTTHFEPILTAELLIAHRKGCYATVINSMYDNKPLEQLVGTANAKLLTERVLNNITTTIATVPIR